MSQLVSRSFRTLASPVEEEAEVAPLPFEHSVMPGLLLRVVPPSRSSGSVSSQDVLLDTSKGA